MAHKTCSKEEFDVLFRSSITQAIATVERMLGHSIPRDVVIRLHGAGEGGADMSVDDALSTLYLTPDRFYRVIDIGVVRTTRDTTYVFVGVSGHAPGPWESTWNRPPGNGPFKVIIPDLARNAIS